MDARYGYGPNGRALKKDGTERKARRTLTAEETIAQLVEAEARAYSGIGRKILAGSDTLAGFNSGLSIFKGWVNEAKSVSDEDKRNSRRAYLEAQIAALDSKGEIAEEFLPGAAAAIDTINGLYSRIGREYQGLIRDGLNTPENVSDMISAQITPEVRAIVEDANSPDNDPFHDFRRGSNSEADDSADDDTL